MSATLVASCKSKTNPEDKAILKNSDPKKQADIELVFCLDATGSMSGLIQTAKSKIWNIVGVLADGQNAPKIRLGMIFYRDQGDAFVTKKF